MFLWKLGVTLLCRQYVRNLWFVRRNFQQDLSFVSNIFTIIFERVTRIYPIDSCDTRCTRVTVANKHWRLKARVSQTHMCASLSARNEKRGTRKKTGGEKKNEQLHGYVWFLICIAVRRPGRKAFREFFQLGKPFEYSPSFWWLSIQSALSFPWLLF